MKVKVGDAFSEIYRIYQICLKYDLKGRILSVTLKWHLKSWTLIEIRIYQLEIARTLI